MFGNLTTLLLSLLGFAGLAIACKAGQLRGAKPFAFNVILYGVCTACCLAWMVREGNYGPREAGFWIAAAATGVFGSIAMVALLIAIRSGPFAPSNAIMAASVLIPTVVSMVFFGERAGAMRWAGLAAVLGSFLSAGIESKGGAASPDGGAPASAAPGPAAAQRPPHDHLKWLFWIGLCWATNGAAQAAETYVAKSHTECWTPFLVAAYGAGAVTLGPFAVLRRQSPSRTDWTFGTFAGIGSLIGMICLVLSLSAMDAMVVFPVSIAGPMALVLIAGRYLFGEKLKAKDWCTVVLASGGSVLLAVP